MVVLRGAPVVDPRAVNDLRRPAPFLADDRLLDAGRWQMLNGPFTEWTLLARIVRPADSAAAGAPRVPPAPQQSGPDSRSHPSSSGTRGLGHAADRFG